MTHGTRQGYVAGYNRYLSDDHADTLACMRARANRGYVTMELDDVARVNVGVAIRYGIGRFKNDMNQGETAGRKSGGRRYDDVCVGSRVSAATRWPLVKLLQSRGAVCCWAIHIIHGKGRRDFI